MFPFSRGQIALLDSGKWSVDDESKLSTETFGLLAAALLMMLFVLPLRAIKDESISGAWLSH